MSTTCPGRVIPTSSEATATGGDPSGSVVREEGRLGTCVGGGGLGTRLKDAASFCCLVEGRLRFVGVQILHVGIGYLACIVVYHPSSSLSTPLPLYPPPPVNYLIIECLERYYYFYGADFKVECPVGSGKMLNLLQVSQEICHRVTGLFVPDEDGKR